MSEHERDDLGALLHRVLSAVVERENDLLRGHQVDMWEYVVLSALGRGPAPTQHQLAATVGRDQTRLIPILDRLQARALVARTPDPRDRRNRVVSLTGAGRELLSRCRDDVRAMEAEVLSCLEPDSALTTIRALVQLADAVRPRP